MKQHRSPNFARFFNALKFAVVLASLDATKRERLPVAEEYDGQFEPVPSDEAQLPAHMVRSRAARRAATQPYYLRD